MWHITCSTQHMSDAVACTCGNARHTVCHGGPGAHLAFHAGIEVPRISLDALKPRFQKSEGLHGSSVDKGIRSGGAKRLDGVINSADAS